jgi:hypothetical protein
MINYNSIVKTSCPTGYKYVAPSPRSAHGNPFGDPDPPPRPPAATRRSAAGVQAALGAHSHSATASYGADGGKSGAARSQVLRDVPPTATAAATISELDIAISDSGSTPFCDGDCKVKNLGVCEPVTCSLEEGSVVNAQPSASQAAYLQSVVITCNAGEGRELQRLRAFLCA